MANKFVENAFDPKIRQFRRTQALGLISTMFHNQALVQSAPSDIDVGKIALDIQGHFLKDLDKYQNNGDMKPRYLCELLNIMHGLHVSKCELNWDSIKLALEKFREKVPKNRHFHDVKKAFNKIGAALKIPVVTGSEKKRLVFFIFLLLNINPMNIVDKCLISYYES